MKNDALAKQIGRAGIYEEHDIVNGKRSWKKGNSAIWFSSEMIKWVIENLNDIGTRVCGIL